MNFDTSGLDTDSSGRNRPDCVGLPRPIDLEALVLGVLQTIDLPDHILVETEIRISRIYGVRSVVENSLYDILSAAIRDCVREDGRISLVCDARRGCCLITVEDRSTGPAPRAWSPRPASFMPGDGMQRRGKPLAVTRRLVEESGGGLAIEPAGVRHGATYRLWWPAPDSLAPTAVC